MLYIKATDYSVLFFPAFSRQFCSMISIKKLLEYMESGQVFSMEVVAYDRTRKQGGQIKEYPEAVLVKREQAGQTERALTKMEMVNTGARKKGANHKKHYTRNIRILQNGHPTGIIKKIHPPLILKFNDQTVTA